MINVYNQDTSFWLQLRYPVTTPRIRPWRYDILTQTTHSSILQTLIPMKLCRKKGRTLFKFQVYGQKCWFTWLKWHPRKVCYFSIPRPPPSTHKASFRDMITSSQRIAGRMWLQKHETKCEPRMWSLQQAPFTVFPCHPPTGITTSTSRDPPTLTS